MARRLYTVVCEYRGGTYISQHRADDEVSALEAWARYFTAKKPAGRASRFVAKNAVADLEEFPPVPLDGVVGVWCCTANAGGDMALINIILTAAPLNMTGN